MNVCVLGAGVVGLTTAVELQKMGLKVTIFANKFDRETTSDGAAGIFRPGHGFSAPSPQLTKEWVIQSYEYYMKLLDKNCGVKEVSGFIFSNTDPSIVENELLEGLLPEYRDATKEELTSSGFKYGKYFKTLVIECRIYLPWLRKMFLKNGGKIIQKHIDKIDDEFKEFAVVVNCTGLGSLRLFNDTKLVPISGQVIKVEAPWVDKFYYLDYDTYIVPGINHVTLGGSRKYDSWNTSVNKYTSQEIWENCTKLLPSLKDAKVIEEWVGLRPHRGGVRVEQEYLNGLKIVHNYGHGGYGVTTAPGTSKHAVNLVIHFLQSQL